MYFRLMKNDQMQVELCEIPPSGARRNSKEQFVYAKRQKVQGLRLKEKQI